MPRIRPQCLLGSLCIAAALQAAPNPNLWVAGNDAMEIAIDRATGRIDRLLDKASREDFCNQSLCSATSDTDGNTGIAFEIGRRYAGLALFDELRGKEYSDLTEQG